MSTGEKPERADAVAKWWADNPMTYGSSSHGGTEIQGQSLSVGTAEYFTEVDREFARWNEHLHEDRLFSRIFPYERYVGGQVLEVGCGQGTMASTWARAGAVVTAVDLNPQAVEQTTRRFELFDLDGTIRSADGRELPFADDSFDYVYSWGVLHHSDDLNRSLSELMRVLRPGGGFGVMLYNRQSFMQWWIIQYFEGFVHDESRFLDRLRLTSRYTDGWDQEGNPHTWPVTRQELRDFWRGRSKDLRVAVLDRGVGVWWYLPPRLSGLMPMKLQRPLARRFGWSIWAFGTKDR